MARARSLRWPVWLAAASLGLCVVFGLLAQFRHYDWDGLLVLFATVIEAGSLWALYHLEATQDRRQQAVDVQLEIAYPEGLRHAGPRVWLDNAGAGPCFIESVTVRLRPLAPAIAVDWHCELAGKRNLQGHTVADYGFEGGIRKLVVATQPGAARMEIGVQAAARIRGREDPIKSPEYRAWFTGEVVLDGLDQIR